MATLGGHLDSFWKGKNLNWGSFWTILVYGHVQGHSLLPINVGGSSLQWVIPVWQVDLVCKRKADEQVRGIMSESRVPLWSLFQFLPLVSCLVSLQDGLYPISWSNPHSILDFVMGLVTTTESKLEHFNNTSRHPCPETQWEQVSITAITWLPACESTELFYDEGIMLPSHLMPLALFLWVLVAICFKNLMYSLQETKRMKIALLENSKLL